MSFTPGPWGVRPDEFGNLTVYQKEDGYEIATIFPNRSRDCLSQMEANARAIAELPEMMDLLDDVAMELSIISPILQPTNGHVEALIERIDAILRRIEGEEETDEL